MQELYIWIIAAVALGAAGFLAALRKAWKARKKMLGSVPEDESEEIRGNEVFLKDILKRQTMLYIILAVPVFIYTVLGGILLHNIGVQTDPQMRVAAGGLLALGLSAFFVNVGRSMIFDEVMEGLNEVREGSRKDFGRYIIYLMFFETPAFFVLVFFMMGTFFSGIVGGFTELSMSTADMYFYGSFILGSSSVATIVMGRNFNSVEGPVGGDQDIAKKKMIKLAIPQVFFTAALIIALVLLMQSGMIG